MNISMEKLAGPDRSQKRKNRHIVVALNHLNRRRDLLIRQLNKLSLEIGQLDDAIHALAPNGQID